MELSLITLSFPDCSCYINLEDLEKTKYSEYDYLNSRFKGNKTWMIQYKPSTRNIYVMTGYKSINVSIENKESIRIEEYNINIDIIRNEIDFPVKFVVNS